MAIQQSFNNRINAWVKFKTTSRGARIMNVKQDNPTQKFKGVPVSLKSKRR